MADMSRDFIRLHNEVTVRSRPIVGEQSKECSAASNSDSKEDLRMTALWGTPYKPPRGWMGWSRKVYLAENIQLAWRRVYLWFRNILTEIH